MAATPEAGTGRALTSKPRPRGAIVTSSVRPVGSLVASVRWSPVPDRAAATTFVAAYSVPPSVTFWSVPCHWRLGVWFTLCEPTRNGNGAYRAGGGALCVPNWFSATGGTTPSPPTGAICLSTVCPAVSRNEIRSGSSVTTTRPAPGDDSVTSAARAGAADATDHSANPTAASRRTRYPTSGAATHGAPEQGSVTAPFGAKKSDFCCRAAGVRRGYSCGSSCARFGWFTSGGAATRAAPVSQYTIAEPPNG